MTGSLLCRLSCFALLLLAASAATAQQDPEAQALPRIDEIIEVTLANADVIVTDKQGNRVRGLTADDFELLEKGKPQVITNFAEYSSEASLTGAGGVETPDSAGEPSVASQPRTIVIFTEPFILPAFSAKPLFDGLRESVKQMVRPGDKAAIVTWADAVIVRQDFTDDVPKLIAALNKIEVETTGVPGNPAHGLRLRDELTAMFEGSLAVESFKQMNERTKHHWDALDRAMFQLFKIKQKTFVLTSLMQRMSAYEGKKIVLMSTNRFGEIAGAEYFGGIVPGEYRAILSTERYRKQLTSTANAYGITIYPLYALGMSWTAWNSADTNRGAGPPNADADMRRTSYDSNNLLNELASLETIAEETGGKMQWSSKEIVALLPEITEDLESYYSLGWRVHGPANESQKIVVRTKNRDYHVRVRREYAFRSDEAKMNDRVVANLFSNVLGGVIPVEAKVGRVRKTGSKRWVAPLHVRIPIEALTVVETDKGPGGEFSVFVAPGAVFGLATDVQHRTQKFTVDAKQLGRARKSHFTYEFELKLDHLVDRISVGVLDETSKEFGVASVKVPERKASDARVASDSGAERSAPEPLGPQGWDGRRQ